MARPIRIQDPELIFHICNRTAEARYLFVPDDELNEIAHYWLRRSILMFEPELFVGVLMSNHPHLIARFPHMNMDRFMGYFQTNLSREVNVLRGRYEATVFPERYKSEPILDPPALLRMMSYVLCNPVAANLVERPEQWPGLTTYRQNARLEEPNPLPLTVPPCWADLPRDVVAANLRELVEPAVQRHANERRWRVMGPDRVRQQKWWRRPRRPKRGRRAVCHGSTKLSRWWYANFFDRVQTRYRGASLARRRGEQSVEFPYGTIPRGEDECSTSEPHRRPHRLLRSALLGVPDSDEP